MRIYDINFYMHSAPQMSTCPPVDEFTIFKSFQSNLIVGALIQVYNVANETSDGATHIVCKTTCGAVVVTSSLVFILERMLKLAG